jgi:hypothetical protein
VRSPVHAKQRQAPAPLGVVRAPVRDRYRRVAVRIAVDVPLEAERDQRRGLHDELARGNGLRRLRAGRAQVEARGDSGSRQSWIDRAHVHPPRALAALLERKDTGATRVRPSAQPPGRLPEG